MYYILIVFLKFIFRAIPLAVANIWLCHRFFRKSIDCFKILLYIVQKQSICLKGSVTCFFFISNTFFQLSVRDAYLFRDLSLKYCLLRCWLIQMDIDWPTHAIFCLFVTMPSSINYRIYFSVSFWFSLQLIV